MNRLQGKVAIVTGGARGIGEAIARQLVQEGARVVVADVQEELGKSVVESIRLNEGMAEFMRTDVSKAQEVERLVASTVDRFGRLDIMVANAGIQIEKTLTETTEEDWERVLSVNLKGVFLCCKYAVLQMLQNGGGSIIATGSALSLVAEPALAAYCASKGGVLMLVRSIATDYGAFNIRANCLCPGYIDTPLCEQYYTLQPDPAEAKRQAGALHALGRTGAPEEVAQCAVFLASDESSFVTGSAMLVDGGLLTKV